MNPLQKSFPREDRRVRRTSERSDRPFPRDQHLPVLQECRTIVHPRRDQRTCQGKGPRARVIKLGECENLIRGVVTAREKHVTVA